MALSPVFPATVDPAGVLHCEDKPAWTRHVQRYRGQKVELVLRRRTSQRSLEQNKWLWGVAYKLLGEHFGYDRHETEALHYGLLGTCFGLRTERRTGMQVPNVSSSSKLSTKEFSDYMEWLVRWAAQTEGVVIPLPDDVDLSGVDDDAAA